MQKVMDAVMDMRQNIAENTMILTFFQTKCAVNAEEALLVIFPVYYII